MQLYKTVKEKLNSIYYFLLLLIIIVPFIFLQPKLSSAINRYKRIYLWQQFEKKITSDKFIDGREFWQLREFYYPGDFIVNKEGFDDTQVFSFLKQTNLSIKEGVFFYPFLLYKSDKFNSLEALVTKNIISLLFEDPNLNNKKIILDTANQLVFFKNNKQIVLVFIKPMLEMKTTNGFFDYEDRERELTKYKLWLSISVINLD